VDLKTTSQSIRIGNSIKKTNDRVRYIEINSTQIESLLFTNGIKTSVGGIGDSDYSVMDESWFRDVLLKEFNSFLTDIELKNKYDYPKNDCDDYTRSFSFFCRLKSYKLMDVRYTMSVGDVFYRRNNGSEKHSMNFAIVLTKEGLLKLIYIEPQTPCIINQDDYKNISPKVCYWSI